MSFSGVRRGVCGYNFTMSKTTEILREAPLFMGLADSDLELAAASAVQRKLEAGGYYFYQGDPADRIFVLVEGRIKLTQSNPDGQQVLLRIAGPNALFGAVAMASVENYPVTAQAAEDCAALAWTKTAMMELVGRIPTLALNAMKLMAAHTQEFQERYRQLATERVERRLARTLLRLASQTGKKVPEGVLIDLPLTRQDLAEMTGTTLFTVSRTLSAWEAKGLVILGRERVIIHFPHGLVSIAEDL
jgi:CRP/FNR family transcriptional regulator, nitrogen oxide reductase regulator